MEFRKTYIIHNNINSKALSQVLKLFTVKCEIINDVPNKMGIVNNFTNIIYLPVERLSPSKSIFLFHYFFKNGIVNYSHIIFVNNVKTKKEDIKNIDVFGNRSLIQEIDNVPGISLIDQPINLYELIQILTTFESQLLDIDGYYNLLSNSVANKLRIKIETLVNNKSDISIIEKENLKKLFNSVDWEFIIHHHKVRELKTIISNGLTIKNLETVIKIIK